MTKHVLGLVLGTSVDLSHLQDLWRNAALHWVVILLGPGVVVGLAEVLCRVGMASIAFALGGVSPEVPFPLILPIPCLS